MILDDVGRAVRAVIAADEDFDALQITALGPEVAEVKVRLAVDGSWVQGVVFKGVAIPSQA